MPDKLLRAAVSVEAAEVERAVAAFELAGVYDSVIEWQVGEPVEEPSWGQPAPHANPLPDRADVAAYLPPQRWAEISSKLARALNNLWRTDAAPPVSLEDIPQRDWRTAWHEHFNIVRVPAARTIVIRPPHIAYEPSRGELVIDLAPGLAFGTAQHQSTRLALALLADACAETTPARTLDLGTGSGILAAAAAKLGAPNITAVDIDPIAVDAAQETARRNQVADQIHVQEGGIPANQRYDLILANLTADLLQHLAPEIAAAAAPGGCVIASGFLAGRRDEVAQALSGGGLLPASTRSEDDWSALLATNR